MSTASPDGAPQSANDAPEVASVANDSEASPLRNDSQKQDVSIGAGIEASPSAAAVVAASEAQAGQDAAHATSQADAPAAAEATILANDSSVAASDPPSSAPSVTATASEGQTVAAHSDAAPAASEMGLQQVSEAQPPTSAVEPTMTQTEFTVPPAEIIDGSEDAVASEATSRLGAASPSAAATSTAAVQSTPLAPIPQKKFTSLNVNKIFLEKASPTPSHNVATVSLAAPKALPNGGLSQSSECIEVLLTDQHPLRPLTRARPHCLHCRSVRIELFGCFQTDLG